jgi:Flp pilus assembly protein TadD
MCNAALRCAQTVGAPAYLERAAEANPEDAETLMDLGAAYARNNDPVEAIGAWQKALVLLNPKKGKDKQNIESILENVRMVQRALKDTD